MRFLESTIDTIVKFLTPAERERVIRTTEQFNSKLQDIIGLTFFENGNIMGSGPSSPKKFKIIKIIDTKRVQIKYANYSFVCDKYIDDFFWNGKYIVMDLENLAVSMYKKSKKVCLNNDDWQDELKEERREMFMWEDIE